MNVYQETHPRPTELPLEGNGMHLCGKLRIVALLACMATVWLSPGTAAAQDDAVAFLQGVNKELSEEVSAPNLTDRERQRNFRAILQRVFGLDEICLQVLGRYGRSAAAEERQEFRQLFEDMLVMTWTRRFRDYTGLGIRFGTTVISANGDLLIQSEINTDQKPLVVEWRLRGDGGDYRLLDIKAEGASMLLTYRSEYQSILRNGGMTELNGLLRKKIGELGVPG